MKTTGLNQSLRQHRLAAGISVADVALKSGVPIKTIDRLEVADLRWVNLDQLHRIARTLKLRVTIELIGKRAGDKLNPKPEPTNPLNPEAAGGRRGTN